MGCISGLAVQAPDELLGTLEEDLGGPSGGPSVEPGQSIPQEEDAGWQRCRPLGGRVGNGQEPKRRQTWVLGSYPA